MLNVSRPTISSWEIGRNYPDLETIIAISDLFGISLDHLLREDKEMAKDTTKKIKNGRIYKYVLIGLAVIVIPYSAFHLKLRYDEHTYRTNLDQRHWVQLSDTDSPDSDGNAYELIENTIHYWTYVLPTGWVGFPLDEQKLSIVTNKEDFFITIDHDGKIGVSISPENDANFNKQVYVNTNK